MNVIILWCTKEADMQWHLEVTVQGIIAYEKNRQSSPVKKEYVDFSALFKVWFIR